MTRGFAIVTIVLSFLSGAVSTAFAGPALNFCDWDSPWSPWAVAGSLTARRDGATATVLLNGRVLIVGGWDGVNTVGFAEIYDPATDTSTTTGSLATDRTSHVAVLLSTGRVLIAGGIQIANGAMTARLASAEVFDPASGTFTPVSSMGTDRQDAVGALLADGRVLVTGGFGSVTPTLSNWLRTAELFDPATGAFSPASGQMVGGRALHRLTRLQNGTVLVSGGYNGFTSLNGAELFNPATGTFTSTGSMQQARAWHTATLMPSGGVMVTGGHSGSAFLSSVEVFNPANGTFSTSIPMLRARAAHAVTLLPNGRALITGGENATGALTSAEWTHRSGTGYESLSALPDARSNHIAALLPNGHVFLAGGRNGGGELNTAVLFDPFFSAAGSMSAIRSHHTATRLASGQVLIVGGQSTASQPVASADLYNPQTRSFSPTGSMSTPRYFHTATRLVDGRVLIVGGASGFSQPAVASAEIFNPATGTFTAAGSMANARYSHTATLLPSGLVLVTGGWAAGARLSSAELYNPATNTFTSTGSMNRDRVNHAATLLHTGQVLITGGWSTAAGGITFSTELYDVASGTFTMPTQPHWLWTNRAYHTATALPNGNVLITGGITSGITPTKKAEIYVPGTNSFHWTGDMTIPRSHHTVTATDLPGGELIVLGAMTGGEKVELYDPATEAFREAPSMQMDRYNHTATLLTDTSILVTGGYGNGWASAELSKPTRCGPAIAMLSPSAGPEGTTVAISGSQFGGTQGISTVTFNGIAATVTSWSDTHIVVTVPSGATTGPVVVTVNGRASNGPTFTVGLGDLVVLSLATMPVTPAPGQSVSVTMTVMNQGTLATDGFYVDFYKHRTTPPGFAYGDAYCLRGPLAPGATDACTVTVSYATAGTYSIWAQVDADRDVPETDEGNNVLGPQTLTVQPPLPDLVENGVSNPPTQAEVGSSFAASDAVSNIGPGAAAASTTRYYLSIDSRKDPLDRLLTGVRSVGALPSGSTSTGTTNVTVPAHTAAGTYVLLACADDTAVVTESSEANNCAASRRTVQITGPDLVETGMQNPPSTALAATSFTMADAVVNQGSVTAGASSVRYYLSLNTVKDASDVLMIGARPVGALAPGAASKSSVTLTIPTTAPGGLYHLLACADDTAAVAETDENNNCIASGSRIDVTAPDLVAAAVEDPPSRAAIGDSFSVKDEVRNQGSTGAGAPTTQYYLSVDAVWDPGDTLLTGSRSIPALGPGVSDSDVATLEIAKGTVPDNYFLLACADDTQLVAEVDETNNCVASKGMVNVTP